MHLADENNFTKTDHFMGSVTLDKQYKAMALPPIKTPLKRNFLLCRLKKFQSLPSGILLYVDKTLSRRQRFPFTSHPDPFPCPVNATQETLSKGHNSDPLCTMLLGVKIVPDSRRIYLSASELKGTLHSKVLSSKHGGLF